MATIYNTDLLKTMIDGAGIQISKDVVPNQLAEKVLPVMETNPNFFKKITVLRETNGTNSVATTIYTTPTDRDFFLCGCSVSFAKDVTATSLSSSITADIDRVNRVLILLNTLSLTIERGSEVINFIPPVKIDRGASINQNNSTNVGNVYSRGIIWGYLGDYSN